MNRLNTILIIVLVVQLALTALVFWPKSTVQAGTPLLADFAADEVVKLTIHDDNENMIVLAKSNEDWVLPEADNFPVQADNVSTLLEKLEGIKGNRLVTQTEASHNRLKVGENDFNRLVEIELTDGTRHNVYVGSSGGTGATHIRISTQPEVYLADINTFEVNAQASSWVDTLYFNIPSENVVAVTLENENGTFDFIKNGETWTMTSLTDDEIFNETSLTGMLTSVTSVQMAAPLGTEEEPTYGFDNPLATVSLAYTEADSSKTASIKIGSKTEDNTYILKSSESPYYITVAEFTGNSLVDKNRDDFLQDPPGENAEENSPDITQ